MLSVRFTSLENRNWESKVTRKWLGNGRRLFMRDMRMPAARL